MKIKFLKAQKSDILVLVDLINSSYRSDSSKKGWTNEVQLFAGNIIDEEVFAKRLLVPLTDTIQIRIFN
jgi:hypothetical protein